MWLKFGLKGGSQNFWDARMTSSTTSPFLNSRRQQRIWVVRPQQNYVLKSFRFHWQVSLKNRPPYLLKSFGISSSLLKMKSLESQCNWSKKNRRRKSARSLKFRLPRKSWRKLGASLPLCQKINFKTPQKFLNKKQMRLWSEHFKKKAREGSKKRKSLRKEDLDQSPPMIQGALSYLTSDRKSIRLTGTIEIGITKDLHATMRIDIPLDTIEEMTGEIETLIDDTAKGPDLDQGLPEDIIIENTERIAIDLKSIETCKSTFT